MTCKLEVKMMCQAVATFSSIKSKKSQYEKEGLFESLKFSHPVMYKVFASYCTILYLQKIFFVLKDKTGIFFVLK